MRLRLWAAEDRLCEENKNALGRQQAADSSWISHRISTQWCLVPLLWRLEQIPKSALLARGHCCVWRPAWGRDLTALHHGHEIQPFFIPHSELGARLQTFPEHGGVTEEDQSVSTLPMKHSKVAEVRGAGLQPHWSRCSGSRRLRLWVYPCHPVLLSPSCPPSCLTLVLKAGIQ